MEWTKWTAMMEMAVLAKDGKKVRMLLQSRTPIIEPTEPIYEIEIKGETEAEKEKRYIRNQDKIVNWENPTAKNRERGNNLPRDEADAKVRRYKSLCIGAEGQRQLQQNVLDSRTSLTRFLVQRELHLPETTEKRIIKVIPYGSSRASGTDRLRRHKR